MTRREVITLLGGGGRGRWRRAAAYLVKSV
jgi:hypothetical protein